MSCLDIWLESQLFRESESSLKFFLSGCEMYHFVCIRVCSLWWWSSLLETWSQSSHVFSPGAGSLLSRNPESFSGTRRPGRPGQQWAEPVWAQFNHRQKRQQRHTGPRPGQQLLSTLLRLSAESRLGWGWICGNFLKNRLSGDSLSLMSNVKLGKSAE